MHVFIFDILTLLQASDKTSTKQSFRCDTGLVQSPLASESDTLQEAIRPRSSTVCSSHGETIKKELQEIKNKRRNSKERMETKDKKIPSPVKSPIMEM